MEVKLISLTKLADTLGLPGYLKDKNEGLMAYTARVSSPDQENPNYAKLLSYCIKHGHWSVFEMVDMTVEIVTSRAIAQQILRHRSFCFQEFSQRYAEVTDFEIYGARRQDLKNRQNSVDDMSEGTKDWFLAAQKYVQHECQYLYDTALAIGIAKEQARFLLPLSTQTRLYMKGSVRSWIHYLNSRTDPATQQEHREIANKIKEIFIKNFPIVSEALEWEKT